MDRLTQFFTRNLHLYDESGAEREKVDKVLDEVTINGVVKYIKDGNCKNIIVMVGAGISTCML